MDALSINETRSAIFCDCAAVRATDKTISPNFFSSKKSASKLFFFSIS